MDGNKESRRLRDEIDIFLFSSFVYSAALSVFYKRWQVEYGSGYLFDGSRVICFCCLFLLCFGLEIVEV